MAGGLLGWVATWDGEKVLHWTVSLVGLAGFVMSLHTKVEPWRRRRWCRRQRKRCLGHLEQMRKVPEKHREWAKWGHERQMFVLEEREGGDIEIWVPDPNRPLVTFLD